MYNGISLKIVDGMAAEAYRLSVSSSQVVIEASDAAGIFYGVQTLLQMMPPAVYGQTDMELTRYELDAVVVEDAPRYGYRGTMLDVSRTFYDVDHVLRLIDWMAYHKLNYTQKEIREVVKYAAERHIEIIPEIDLPGHSRSLVGVFPEMACPVDVPYISANGETDRALYQR